MTERQTYKQIEVPHLPLAKTAELGADLMSQLVQTRVDVVNINQILTCHPTILSLHSAWANETTQQRFPSHGQAESLCFRVKSVSVTVAVLLSLCIVSVSVPLSLVFCLLSLCIVSVLFCHCFCTLVSLYCLVVSLLFLSLVSLCCLLSLVSDSCLCIVCF